MHNSLQSNFQAIQQRIEAACQAAGRDSGAVKLIWVSKTHPKEMVEAALALGATEFGENRVQEALEKFVPPRPGVRCHIIGPVQSNKLRKAASVAQSIDSVSSLDQVLRLDEMLDGAVRAGLKPAPTAPTAIDLLFQINTSEESTKSGLHKENARDFLNALPLPKNLTYKGLMTIGKNTGDPEDSRECFAWLRNLRDEFRQKGMEGDPRFAGFTELSMGMTDDLEVAIAEGSTQVRIGTALFGKRDYSLSTTSR
jgi:pyridoxal phosphate enzyme (YggS family)